MFKIACKIAPAPPPPVTVTVGVDVYPEPFDVSEIPTTSISIIEPS